MKLKRIKIDRNWTGDAYQGVIEFDCEAGSIALVLTPAQVERIFDFVADSVVAVARDAAENLTAQALDHKRALLESNP